MTADYLFPIFDNPAGVLKTAARHLPLSDIDFFVGTGLSGTVAATLFGFHFGKPFAVVRKESPTVSCHSRFRVEGVFEDLKRYAFVDDLISTGDTRSRVLGEMDRLNKQLIHVGDYLYAYNTGWRPAPATPPAPEPDLPTKAEFNACLEEVSDGS